MSLDRASQSHTNPGSRSTARPLASDQGGGRPETSPGGQLCRDSSFSTSTEHPAQ